MLESFQLPARRAHSARVLMPRLLAVLSLACCVLLGTPALAGAETRMTDIVCGVTAEERGLADADLPDIEAAQAIVMDPNGTVYFERDADTQTKIASITKS